MSNNEILCVEEIRAIKLACHQDLCKARFESNFGPEATDQLQMTAFTGKRVKQAPAR